MRKLAFDLAVRDLVERIPLLTERGIENLHMTYPDEWDLVIKAYYQDAGLSEIFEAIQDSRYVSAIEKLLVEGNDPIELSSMINTAKELHIRDYVCRQISLQLMEDVA